MAIIQHDRDDDEVDKQVMHTVSTFANIPGIWEMSARQLAVTTTAVADVTFVSSQAKQRMLLLLPPPPLLLRWFRSVRLVRLFGLTASCS